MMNISIRIKCNIKIETHLSIFAACHMYTEYIQTRTVSLSLSHTHRNKNNYVTTFKRVKLLKSHLSLFYPRNLQNNDIYIKVTTLL